MNPLRIFCLVACLLAAASANKMMGNSVNQSLKPSHWLTPSQLESIPSVDEVTLERLENMSVEEGSKLLQQIYHLSQINQDLNPSFVPNLSNIPAYIIKPGGQKVEAPLNQIVEKAKQQQNFGDDEVTIFITGLPQNSQTVKKATRKLVQAYMQRYNPQAQQQQQQQSQKNNKDYDYVSGKSSSQERTSSEEENDSWKSAKSASGDLIVIDLGSTLTSFKRYAMLDIQETGAQFGKLLVQMTNQLDVPIETIQIVAQGPAAHVAGAAANEFTRLTGHKLRRIIALDPSKIYAKKSNTLTGLSRGDADNVVGIHTTSYGMGSLMRVGDVDFFVDGPTENVSGAQNVVEASMRATRYFAESVRPGNERNFPAVQANSLKQYKNNNGFGKRTYMGIDTAYDIEGDYILQVNPKSPFGKNAPAQKQNNYHGVHSGWKNENGRDNE